ncbi:MULTISPECIES: alpha/beta fold hydrolase [Methylobacterium]|uniref:alpha/beta fold hydrolase n=1 Tax=Methylobacterium TaxID=407 RepID=UPI0009E75B9C
MERDGLLLRSRLRARNPLGLIGLSKAAGRLAPFCRKRTFRNRPIDAIRCTKRLPRKRPRGSYPSGSDTVEDAMAPIRLIHGLFGSLSAPGILSGLGDATVLAPDLIGYGSYRNEAPTAWELSEQADHVASCLGERVDEPVDVVGHSVGGAIAVLFAGRHPKLTKSLTSIRATSRRTTPSGREGLQRRNFPRSRRRSRVFAPMWLHGSAAPGSSLLPSPWKSRPSGSKINPSPHCGARLALSSRRQATMPISMA